MTIERVLCGVDFSDASRGALHYARAIATWYDAELHVLHAFQGTLPVNVPALAALPPMSSVDFRPATESALETLVLTNQAGPAIRVVRDGHPAATIVACAREIGADLIVLGSHGWSGLDRVMLGSTAETVLHRADCPVLTVPWNADEPGAADRFRLTHVLCPVDFSAASLEALELGLSLAQENAARLTTLHVTELPSHDALLVGESRPLREHLEGETRRAAEELSAFIPTSARDWCEIRTVVRNGRPASVILSEAEAGNVDLIVMGSQGRHGVGLALFGSTTQTVVRRAACPVLTTRTSVAERSQPVSRRASG